MNIFLHFSRRVDLNHICNKKCVKSLTEEIFRETNSLVTCLVKPPLLWRNFCQKSVTENSRNFPTVVCKTFSRNISWIHLFSKNVIFTNFLSKMHSAQCGNSRNSLSSIFGGKIFDFSVKTAYYCLLE